MDRTSLSTQTLKGANFAEYIWIDGTSEVVRSKTKVLESPAKSLDDLPWWTYDGSSTYQATTEESEIWLKPIFMCPDPFRKGFGILVLCEGYLQDQKTPARGYFRSDLSRILTEAKSEEPKIGFSQEYFLVHPQVTLSKRPLGWPKKGLPEPEGKYYCSTGVEKNFGRQVAELHLMACLQAGLNIESVNSEKAAGQWGFRIGMQDCLQAADQLWIARYILVRVGESLKLEVTFKPRPVDMKEISGNAGLAIFSTKMLRESKDSSFITSQLERLRLADYEHVKVYGKTIDTKNSTFYLSKTISEKETKSVIKCKISNTKGCIEDFRPRSNADPYLVSTMLVDTSVLEGKHRREIINNFNRFFEETQEIFDN